MSNLHKDLTDAQLHVPKGFANAANSTKLTKNASGVLEWAADSGGGGGVSQIIAGTNITISPTGGTGAVTINSTASATNNGEYFTKGYYINQGDRTANLNWHIKTYNRESLHFVDTRSTGTSFNFVNPIEGVGSSFAIMPDSQTLVRFNGVFSVSANTNVRIGLFLGRPDCSSRLLRTATLIGDTGSVAAVANAAHCFSITPTTTNVLQNDILLIGVLNDTIDCQLAYNGTMLLEF